MGKWKIRSGRVTYQKEKPFDAGLAPAPFSVVRLKPDDIEWSESESDEEG